MTTVINTEDFCDQMCDGFSPGTKQGPLADSIPDPVYLKIVSDATGLGLSSQDCSPTHTSRKSRPQELLTNWLQFGVPTVPLWV